MQKSDLDRLYRIKIPLGVPAFISEEFFAEVIRIIRSHVTELVSVLEKEDKLIDWYYFLIHQEEMETPPYFDIVVSLKKERRKRPWKTLFGD